LISTFKGNLQKIKPASHKILEEMRADHPEYLDRRKSGDDVVGVIVSAEGIAAFIEKMQNAGFKKKS